jgi:hypothetical protein
LANSIIYSGGEGSWSNTIIYSGPTTSANIIYNNKNTNWAIYNNIPVNNIPANINNKLYGLGQYIKFKNTNWAIYNNILNLKNWAKYNSINTPNNRVGGVQYTNKWANKNNNLLKIRAIYNLKNTNKWANNILNLINKWANIKYNSGYTGEYIHNKWANINTLNNKVGGLINNWAIKYIRGANGILNLINRWNVKYINNKIKWAIYNLKNINNKGIPIGLTHNIKLNNLINKMGQSPLKNNI